MDGERERKCSNEQPKISMGYHNTNVFLACMFPRWQCSWAQLDSVGLPPSLHSVPQDEEAATLWGFLHKRTVLKEQAKLKVLLKNPAQNWLPWLPATPHWSEQAQSKAQSQRSRKESTESALGTMAKYRAGWMTENKECHPPPRQIKSE